MADDEQFSLCWNNFNSNLSAGFHESLCRGDLVDVTLAAEGQFIKAHRLVLSVCSPYFRKMFTQMPTNQHAFVFLKDVSHSALKDLIQFMYCGEVNVKQDALPAFISTAEALQIKGLTDGDPAPSQSPAKPSTPAPQQIPAQAQQTVTTSLPRPKARTRTQAQTQQYKIETDDSDVEKATQIVIQTSTAPLTTSTPQTIQVQVQTTQQQQQTQTQQQTQQHQTQTVQIQPQTVVSAQKRVAQKSITPHTVKRTKLVQQPDPLEASEPTQITVQTVTESKTNNETEFIDLPIELPTKSEPEYAEDAGGDVETVEQEATYVEDDSYGDMKYDESYFTENDETGANVGGSGTGTAVQATTSTIKQQQPSFSESYVSDAGDQSATEAQGAYQTIEDAHFIESPWSTPCLVIKGFLYNRHSKKNDKTYWRCHNYSKKIVEYRCRARCVIENGRVTAMTGGEHNHPPHTEKIEKMAARSRTNISHVSQNPTQSRNQPHHSHSLPLKFQTIEHEVEDVKHEIVITEFI
ncbi:modifier of mdg4 isoform X5 [Condylostylus longicornis]|uniref:modifier of mdg4 isoform X5 n=1 Tax=Condylostylus longicornis TaxID=2530218 RepID=UPI00244E065B|nr:modifier of mdg4 isoform X5 [Condylostylus longicornis]